MAYFLAIETATTVCSAALFKGDQLLACKEENGGYSHAEKLAVFIDELLKENQIDHSQLKAVLVSKGPGSYTGLRIGVSLAKGICFSLQIPLIAISTLKSMAWGAKQSLNKLDDSSLCPMIDARRMEVYAAFYNSQLDIVREIQADVIDENSYLDQLDKNKIYFFGNGAEKCVDVIKHENAHFIADFQPSAAFMGELGNEKYLSNKFEDLAYFEPYYLKEFKALKGKVLV